MRPTTVTVSFSAASTTAIALAQAKATAGDLTLNGALVTAGVATLVANAFVTLTSGGNDSLLTATVYGTDSSGWAVSQTVALTNAVTATTTAGFATVTRVSVSGAIATTISVGNARAGYSQSVPMDVNIPAIAIALGVVVAGTISYTVQATLDDIWSTSYNPGTATWFNHPTLAAAATSQSSNYAYPVRAIRIMQVSGTGSAALTIVQSGITGNS